jgi:hypothetical protein
VIQLLQLLRETVDLNSSRLLGGNWANCDGNVLDYGIDYAMLRSTTVHTSWTSDKKTRRSIKLGGEVASGNLKRWPLKIDVIGRRTTIFHYYIARLD